MGIPTLRSRTLPDLPEEDLAVCSMSPLPTRSAERRLVMLTPMEVDALKRIADSLENISAYLCTLAQCVDAEHGGTLRMKDVDRAKVYSTHLGKKLREPATQKEKRIRAKGRAS
jgi:hypothetical protein